MPLSVPCTICACMPWDPNTEAMRSTRRSVVGSSGFASPHPVRRSLTKLLQSPALFGGVFRCARLDYHRLSPHIIKRRQISFSQVGRSHNPLVAGSSPARPTLKALVKGSTGVAAYLVRVLISASSRRVAGSRRPGLRTFRAIQPLHSTNPVSF